MIAGGNWNNSVNSGSHARNFNNVSWNLNANISAHESIQGQSNSLAGLLTLSKGKIQNGESFDLVT